MDEIYNEDGSVNRDKWLDFVIRPKRDGLLAKADVRVRRYDLQLRAALPTSETAEKIAEILAYMQVLRDLPNNEALMPENLVWPSIP